MKVGYSAKFSCRFTFLPNISGKTLKDWLPQSGQAYLTKRHVSVIFLRSPCICNGNYAVSQPNYSLINKNIDIESKTFIICGYTNKLSLTFYLNI